MIQITEWEWQQAERLDPSKTYFEPAIKPSYKWAMRGAAVCFLAMGIVPLGTTLYVSRLLANTDVGSINAPSNRSGCCMNLIRGNGSGGYSATVGGRVSAPPGTGGTLGHI